jgi:hypothetical protein
LPIGFGGRRPRIGRHGVLHRLIILKITNVSASRPKVSFRRGALFLFDSQVGIFFSLFFFFIFVFVFAEIFSRA